MERHGRDNRDKMIKQDRVTAAGTGKEEQHCKWDSSGKGQAALSCLSLSK